MILDDIHNYDIAHVMGINLSSFSRSMTYFACSFLVLGIFILFLLIRSEKNRVQHKNEDNKRIAQEETEKYKLLAKSRFHTLNLSDSQLSSFFENISHIIETINHFIYINKNDPVYINFIREAEQTVTQQIFSHNQLLDSLNEGHEIDENNPIFLNYKMASINLLNTYQNILKFGIKSQPVSDNQIVNINDI